MLLIISWIIASSEVFVAFRYALVQFLLAIARVRGATAAALYTVHVNAGAATPAKMIPMRHSGAGSGIGEQC